MINNINYVSGSAATPYSWYHGQAKTNIHHLILTRVNY